MKKLFLAITLILIALLLVSCNSFSSDLSRSKAESILKSYHADIHRYISTTAYTKIGGRMGGKLRIPTPSQSQEKTLLERLQNAGYVSLTEHENELNYWTIHYYYTATSTSKLSPYIISNEPHSDRLKVKIADVVFDKITGITKAPMDETGRIVEFTTKVIPNPLGEFFPLSDQEKQPGPLKAYFKKYDDGWRLVQ